MTFCLFSYGHSLQSKSLETVLRKIRVFFFFFNDSKVAKLWGGGNECKWKRDERICDWVNEWLSNLMRVQTLGAHLWSHLFSSIVLGWITLRSSRFVPTLTLFESYVLFFLFYKVMITDQFVGLQRRDHRVYPWLSNCLTEWTRPTHFVSVGEKPAERLKEWLQFINHLTSGLVFNRTTTLRGRGFLNSTVIFHLKFHHVFQYNFRSVQLKLIGGSEAS